MKKTFLNLALIAVLSFAVSCKNDKNTAGEAQDAATASEEAAPYTVDTESSVIEWTGSKPAGKHNGTINLSAGEIYVNDGKVESGKFTIDMNSIVVLDLAAGDGKEDLEGHLKGAAEDESADHFFNVSKYPEAAFELTSVSTVDGQTTVEGNLTLKGVTKNVKFPATILSDDDSVVLTSETFTINRTDWGVNYASKSIFDDLKDKFVDDNIELKVKVTAKK